jgi:hypothetical protein
MPVELDKHINRYAAASAIEEAVLKANAKDYVAAKKHIHETISAIQKSVSAKHPNLSQYCEDLVADLTECAGGMQDLETYASGIHYAHAYSTMYYMERSTGTSNLLGVERSSAPESLVREKRHEGYGYVTYAQEEEANKAKHETKNFVTGYLDNVL